MEELIERIVKTKASRYTSVLNDFSKLPNKCKEMFFQYLEESEKSGFDGYLHFYVSGMDYSECKSPIEIIFYMAFRIISYDYGIGFELIPQHEIIADDKRYVADFVFYEKENDIFGFGRYKSKNDFKLVIECDGYEYHNSTKEQVAYDNQRDFNLKMAGYDVLRFSGSEIFDNPWKCALKAYAYIRNRVKVVDINAE